MPIDLNFIKSKKWEKTSGRKATFHCYFDYCESGDGASIKFFGFGLKYSMFTVKNGWVSQYHEKKDWQNYIDGFEKYFQDSASVKFGHVHMKANQEAFMGWLKYNCNSDSVKDLSNSKLIKLLMQRHEKRLDFCAWLWFGFTGRHAMEKILLDVLRKYELGEKELKIIFSFDHPVFVFEEELRVKEISRQIQQKKLSDLRLEKAIHDHLSKYDHIGMYDETYEPMSQKDLKERINKFVKNKNLKKEIDEAYKELKKNKKDLDDFLKRNKFSKKEKEIVLFAHDYAEYMELRNNYRGLAAKYSAPFFTEIAGRMGLKINELLSFTDYEIKSALLGKRKLTKKEAESRYSSSVFLYSKGKYFEARGGQATRIEKLLTLESKLKELRGAIANRGLASGRVKIIYTTADMQKLKKGDVLVSPMTRPDFLSAIKKASAIVTDEGGMLCHAAIISRELNKPCVIGTKNGTQVLHDGDIVEVDANKGIVKIIKK